MTTVHKGGGDGGGASSDARSSCPLPLLRSPRSPPLPPPCPPAPETLNRSRTSVATLLVICHPPPPSHPGLPIPLLLASITLRPTRTPPPPPQHGSLVRTNVVTKWRRHSRHTRQSRPVARPERCNRLANGRVGSELRIGRGRVGGGPALGHDSERERPDVQNSHDRKNRSKKKERIRGGVRREAHKSDAVGMVTRGREKRPSCLRRGGKVRQAGTRCPEHITRGSIP